MFGKGRRRNRTAFLFDAIYTLGTVLLIGVVFAVGIRRGNVDGTVFSSFTVGAALIFSLLGLGSRYVILHRADRAGSRVELSNIGAFLFSRVHLPIAVIDRDGKILSSNEAFRTAFLPKKGDARGNDIRDLLAFPKEKTRREFRPTDGECFACESDERVYDVTVNALGQSGNTVLIFEDRTERRELIRQYENARTVVGYLELDNIPELTGGNSASKNKAALDAFDIAVRGWAEENDILIVEHEKWKYLTIMTEKTLERCKSESFLPLLNAIRIKDEGGIELSLSYGLSRVSDPDIPDRNRSALDAFEMALKRGGATVAVKEDSTILYFGGNTITQPRSAKRSARRHAKQLEQAIRDAENVLIMGHSFPDYDCIGAQMGVYCLCRQLGREANIVTNIETHFNIEEGKPILENLQKDAYRDIFISPEDAMDKNGTGTLLVIVDVNNVEKMESRSLFEAVQKVSIIDHHRKTAEYEKAVDTEYIDASASSASELVAEMLEMTDLPAGALLPEEATLMLSGIYLDTDNFRKSTGTRTFSAALYLRGRRADVDAVKRLFDVTVRELELESRISGRYEMHRGCALIFYDTHGERVDPKTRARVADAFVRAKGVDAAFVLCGAADGPVAISARSAGTLNVELIMKSLGGGGSFDRAGGNLTETLDCACERMRETLDDALDALAAATVRADKPEKDS